MKRSTLRNLKIRLVARGLYPRTLLGKYLFYAAVVDLLLWLVRRAIIFFRPGTDLFSGWITLLTALVMGLAFFWGIRWVRYTLMWRLRNRLIVTYVFIGVIPFVLLLAMVGVAAYIFVGQFATYVATNDFTMHLERLNTANRTIMSEARARASLNKFSPQELTGISDDREFPGRQVSLWYAGKGYVLEGAKDVPALPVPAHVQDGFHDIVVDAGKLYLRTVARHGSGKDEIIVVSSLPITQQLALSMAERLGRITLYPPDTDSPAPVQSTTSQSPQQQRPKLTIAGEKSQKTFITLDRGEGQEETVVAAGEVPASVGWWDWELPFGTVFRLKKWTDGSADAGALFVQTRISQLYHRLFETLGRNASIFIGVLAGIGIVLALIELVALIIGIRLSRTMTRSVAELYEATQNVNQGRFDHRIQIRSRDQLAALEGAFNSMTESIEKLIIEQKEKQKLESELAIAQEVQALLFPRQASHLKSFEVHGVCRPARTVSGDYYDFLPLGPNQIGVAVGDISGKGISAALLMATVHAFVRAYTLEEALAEARVGAAVGGSLTLAHPGEHLPPASLLALLNAQLYRSTPAAKYATMFLGFYDGERRRLTYSNAGHLPPYIISGENIRRLDNGGTVVGLFGGMTYENESVDMYPGDIFLAYSDGVTEPENEYGEFGEERLLQIVRENVNQPLSRIAEEVTTAVSDWIGGNEQPDDITVVLARSS